MLVLLYLPSSSFPRKLYINKTICKSLINCLIAATDMQTAVIVFVVCIIPLIALRALRNLIAVPFVILHDYKDCAFAFPTRFRTSVSDDNDNTFIIVLLMSSSNTVGNEYTPKQTEAYCDHNYHPLIRIRNVLIITII